MSNKQEARESFESAMAPAGVINGGTHPLFYSNKAAVNDRLPLSSSPITFEDGTHLARMSLDSSLEMSDISDRFEKISVMDGMDLSIDELKKKEMNSMISQLNSSKSFGVVFRETLNQGSTATNEKFAAENPLLSSLGLTLALLEPAQITSGAVTTALSVRTHRFLQNEKLLASLKAQTAELRKEKETITTTIIDIRSGIESTKKKVKGYEQEMIAVDQEELRMLNAGYEVEIAALIEQFQRVETIESTLTKEKIDLTMTEVKSLQKEAEVLSKELEFTKFLPPNLREIRIRVDERKRHLQDIIHKVEDLMEYGYKH